MKTITQKKLPAYRQLLGVANAKTTKGEELGYLTGILYLAPHTISGRNVCPHASTGCALGCLYTAGRGAFNNVQAARVAKTKEFHADPKGFVEMLARNIERLVKRAGKLGLKPCVRLNGTSDLPWENLGGITGVNLMDRFPNVAMYDYTKNPNRIKPSYRVNLPRNYSLVFSASESNGQDVARAISWGVPVAMVFSGIQKTAEIPALRWGLRIVDGDKHDLRFLDKGAGIVALRAKGEAKKDDTGFVRPFNTRFLSISAPKTPCAI
jgi:hypothetical protein